MRRHKPFIIHFYYILNDPFYDFYYFAEGSNNHFIIIYMINMNLLEDLISNKLVFFNFMKVKYPFYQNSNVFFRDIQYAIKSYFERKNKFLKYSETEKLAFALIAYLESTNQFIKVGNNAWKVNFSLNNIVTDINEETINSN